MAPLIHQAARDLWSASLAHDDRVLVTGASGWFGRTACALMAGTDKPLLATASSAKDVRVGTQTVRCVGWDFALIQDFEPTLVIDCAFLTREKAAAMTLDAYLGINESLTQRLLDVTRMPSVKRAVTISSGAAMFPVDALTSPREVNPYGWLKRQAELALANVAQERGVAATVARTWSVSGAFVGRPSAYAFSDMILQALAGAVHVTASSPVYRRYTSVEDLLAVAVASAAQPSATVIDSGGPLLEMGELAEAIVRVVNPGATVTRAESTDDAANRFYADPGSWDRGCASTGLVASDIDQQIRIAAAGLTASPGETTSRVE